MNYLTKEELKELHCVWANMLDLRDATTFEAILLNKLELMIENYEDNFDLISYVEKEKKSHRSL